MTVVPSPAVIGEPVCGLVVPFALNFIPPELKNQVLVCAVPNWEIARQATLKINDLNFIFLVDLIYRFIHRISVCLLNLFWDCSDNPIQNLLASVFEWDKSEWQNPSRFFYLIRWDFYLSIGIIDNQMVFSVIRW